jgi:hypothetical protein
MVLGMSLETFALVHVLISLVGLFNTSVFSERHASSSPEV